MTLLNDAELETIANSIAEVERTTDAELVMVLARQADNYLYIPTLYAALVALLAPLVLKLTPL